MRNFLRAERGESMNDTGLLVGLIAVIIVATLRSLFPTFLKTETKPAVAVSSATVPAAKADVEGTVVSPEKAK